MDGMFTFGALKNIYILKKKNIDEQSWPRDPESCQFLFTGSKPAVLASKTLYI